MNSPADNSAFVGFVLAMSALGCVAAYVSYSYLQGKFNAPVWWFAKQFFKNLAMTVSLITLIVMAGIGIINFFIWLLSLRWWVGLIVMGVISCAAVAVCMTASDYSDENQIQRLKKES